MDTTIYDLTGVVPDSEQTTGVQFTKLETASTGFSPLAVVWYRTSGEDRERGCRIDLQKQVFLDDLGKTDRSSLQAVAGQIVRFFNAK